MSERVALYPGSFDPVTLGHLDILERATAIFDRVVVSVLRNPAKQPLFTVEERLDMIRSAVSTLNGSVTVDTFQGLTVHHAEGVGAIAIVRGLRALSDFETELQMALMNRRLNPEIHTVFLMTSAENIFMSSSLVKQIGRLGGDITDMVPDATAEAIRRRFGEPK
jgi:pantetheine-phosphate adenylyltransferase